MMQRKKRHTGEYAQLDIIITDNDDDDDDRGGVNGYSSTKKHHQRSTSSSSSRIIISSLKSTDCLPGVPPAFKLILLSFIGFALLVVLTAKGHHDHWHYHVGGGGGGGGGKAPASSAAVRDNYLPESLLDKVRRRKWERRSRNDADGAAVQMKSSKNNEDRDDDDDAPPPSSSSSSSSSRPQQQKHPSSLLQQQQQQQRSTISFVESEKKLKKQLHQLATTQKNDGILLGVPISNRYLGEEDDILLLPHPSEGMSLEEWTRRMERRTQEIIQLETRQWDSVMHQYYEENMKKYDDLYHHPSSLEVPPGAHHHEEEEATTTTTTTTPILENRKRKWPSPLAMAPPDTNIILQPSFGAHRRNKDAILVFAEGYDLSVYMSFIESLSLTGYDGDLVLSIAHGSKLKPHVKEYLQSINNANTGGKKGGNNVNGGGMNIIAYEVDWSCYKSDTSGISVNDANGGQSHCRMNNVFGTTSTSSTTNSSTTVESISDPRTPRPVATARYELYWIWCLQYTSSSWIMLIDARDTWFQLHPFSGLGGSGNDDSISSSSSSNNSSNSSSNKEDDKERKGGGGGELHLFGENADAIRIGTSTYNRNWLITAYGEKHVLPYYTQPVICSGSTIGNQIAIESYLRAMVYQFDSTACKLKGCDQGFHNYLYYSGKLVGGGKGGDNDNDGISKIIVHEQGHGTINNLSALRAKPLSEQGMYDPKREVVLNWDGSVSAVAHQYDRDKEVNNMVKGKKRLFESNWMKQQQQLKR